MVAQEKRASAWGRDGCHGEYQSANHVVLTTHPRRGCPIKIQWGASNPALRGKFSSPLFLCEHARIALGLKALFCSCVAKKVLILLDMREACEKAKCDGHATRVQSACVMCVLPKGPVIHAKVAS